MQEDITALGLSELYFSSALAHRTKMRWPKLYVSPQWLVLCIIWHLNLTYVKNCTVRQWNA